MQLMAELSLDIPEAFRFACYADPDDSCSMGIGEAAQV
jgi:hypothetical protein